MKGRFVVVDIAGNVVLNPAFVMEGLVTAGAFILDADGNAFVEVSQLPQTADENRSLKVRGGHIAENFVIGNKGNFGTGGIGFADDL